MLICPTARLQLRIFLIPPFLLPLACLLPQHNRLCPPVICKADHAKLNDGPRAWISLSTTVLLSHSTKFLKQFIPEDHAIKIMDWTDVKIEPPN